MLIGSIFKHWKFSNYWDNGYFIWKKNISSIPMSSHSLQQDTLSKRKKTINILLKKYMISVMLT